MIPKGILYELVYLSYVTLQNKQVTSWDPREDVRRKGRPKTRWSDDIRLIVGPYWIRVADNRALWRELEQAYAWSHAGIKSPKIKNAKLHMVRNKRA